MPQRTDGPGRPKKKVKKKSVGDAISDAVKGKPVDFGARPKKKAAKRVGVFKPVPRADVKPAAGDVGVGGKAKGKVEVRRKLGPSRAGVSTRTVSTAGPILGRLVVRLRPLALLRCSS